MKRALMILMAMLPCLVLLSCTDTARTNASGSNVTPSPVTEPAGTETVKTTGTSGNSPTVETDLFVFTAVDGGYALRANGALEGNVTLPSAYDGKPVVGIEEAAFRNQNKIVSLLIPDSVEEIGKNAFAGCRALEILTVGSGVKTLAEKAISDCPKLKTVVLCGVKVMQKSCIFNCGTLQTLELGDICEIEDYAYDFENNTHRSAAEPLTVEIGDLARWLNAKHGILGECEILLTERSRLVSHIDLPAGSVQIPDHFFYKNVSLESVGLPQSLKTIGEGAFQGAGLRAAALPEGLTSIGRYAFSGSLLEEVLIPKSVDFVGQNAFLSCKKLKTVKLEEGVRAVGRRAFHGCEALERVDIPASCLSLYLADEALLFDDDLDEEALSVWNNPFVNCPRLADVSVDAQNEWYASDGKHLYTKRSAALVFSADRQIPANGRIAALGSNVFQNVEFDGGETVVPGFIKIIGSGAYSLTNLTFVKVSEGVEQIGSSAFPRETLRGVVLPASLRIIDPKAFGDQTVAGDPSPLSWIYYAGSPEDFQKIAVTGGALKVKATVAYLSETKPADNKEVYWHDVGGRPVLW